MNKIITYKCTHCKTRLVILPTCTGTFLPVEIIDNVIPEEEEYDPAIHKSHLLNCEPRRKDWHLVQKKLIAAEKKKFGMSEKELTK